MTLHRCLRVPILVLLLAMFQVCVRAQQFDCPPTSALLLPTDSVYPDAMELKQLLEDHGFVVRCVFPTKLGGIFQAEEGGVLRSTIEGEANFRTNYGDVDVVFMPKPQTFADFTITERRDGSGFLYRFGGKPRVWETNKFGSARRIYFLEHENQLFFSNQALLPQLEHMLQVRHRPLVH